VTMSMTSARRVEATTAGRAITCRWWPYGRNRVDRSTTMADTDSRDDPARADLQAQTTGTHGRTLCHGPTEACQSSRKAAKLMMATRPAGSRLRASVSTGVTAIPRGPRGRG
jgi:hypothetical protein